LKLLKGSSAFWKNVETARRPSKLHGILPPGKGTASLQEPCRLGLQAHKCLAGQLGLSRPIGLVDQAHQPEIQEVSFHPDDL
jgi:hypothetical protein